jgi:uncharacterized membrane protein
LPEIEKIGGQLKTKQQSDNLNTISAAKGETMLPVSKEPGVPVPQKQRSKRIAAIDWVRGVAMLLMVLDHVSMAYDAHHISNDSAANWVIGTSLGEAEFITRWVSHICAPIFVFLAGTALAISVERKLEAGADAWQLDIGMIKRGAFIAVLDPTVISLFSGGWRFQVLYAIGMAMICMAFIRRLPSAVIMALCLVWLIAGEWITVQISNPTNMTPSIISALLVSSYSSPTLIIKYPLIPWLAMMALGWVFGRYLIKHLAGKTRLDLVPFLWVWGAVGMLTFAVVRYFNGYGNLWLLREGADWIQWLHVSKYPPSLTYTALELGLTAWLLALMILYERRFRIRPNGPLLVFGQTAMFFYLIHRIVLEGSATWLGMRGFTSQLWIVYLISLLLLIALYFPCRWYRDFKVENRNIWWTTYI